MQQAVNVKHERYLIPMLSCIVLVGVLQAFTYLASPGMLEVMRYHYDKIEHLAAGAACGIFGCYLYALLRGGQLGKSANGAMLLCGLMATLMIGGGWEILEHTWPMSMNGEPHSYASWDTIFDVVFDLLGGMIAVLCFRQKN